MNLNSSDQIMLRWDCRSLSQFTAWGLICILVTAQPPVLVGWGDGLEMRAYAQVKKALDDV